MIKIKLFTFGPFQENTYILSNNSGEAIVVDAGNTNASENEIIDEYLSSEKLTLTQLFNTHGHIDHVCGNAYLSKSYNLVPELHPDDVFLTQSLSQQAMMFGFPFDETIQMNTSLLIDGKTIQFGDSQLNVIHVPGHSPGHVVFYCKKDKFLIAGDVLFNGSIGRSDLAGGNEQQLISGIKTKLLTLPGDTIVYSGHGPSTTIGIEKQSNPFLG